MTADDHLAFPWARTYDADQLAAFIEDLWGAASGDNDLATLAAIEKVVAAHRPEPDAFHEPFCPLTETQLAVLIDGVNGQLPAATARRLKLKPTSIYGHRGRAYKRLGVRTLTQAVVVCVTQGWIRRDALNLPDAPVRPFGNQQHAEYAALMRQQPRQWKPVSSYASRGAALVVASRIRTGTMTAYLPPGAYEAEAVTTPDANGEPIHRVRARYVGEPARSQKAAS
ncbi:hypothetical protein ACIRJO_02615 [Streptomyces sp. NPDC102394]|uniref:hypothetical protein n=1 Tax=Streptomyces sp. NPDC102394 TaxID=3366167 RepID=UPI00381C9851